jgi:flagellar biosynthesis protein FlhA
VFGILMVINLVVITKGAGRVSEVSARFTLDAMPGKQMAIDADLNAGLLTPEEAKKRRQEVATEADFYGSMDGASKFVKGDAVAGVLILVINILGGLILGVAQPRPVAERSGLDLYHSRNRRRARRAGAGAAALDRRRRDRHPRLLAARSGRARSPASSARPAPGRRSRAYSGFSASSRACRTSSSCRPPASPASPPGSSQGKTRDAGRGEAAAAELANAPAPVSPHSIDWNEISDGAALGLELGYGLVSLVDERKGAPLMARITGIRRQLSRELGFVVPLVRVRDNLSLPPNAYRITVAGVIMGEDEAFTDQLLALDSGDLDGKVEGREVRDPSFGLEAVWITPDKRGDAIVAGYTVVDPATVVATHLNQVIAGAAADLFGMDEAQRLLDALKEAAPQLVAGLTPNPLSLAQIASASPRAAGRGRAAQGFPPHRRGDGRRCRDFGRRPGSSKISARDRCADRPDAGPGEDAAARRSRSMPGLESLLAQAVRTSPGAAHPFEPALANKIVSAISEASVPLVNTATRFAIVTSPVARRALARLLKPHLPETPVMSFLEIPDGKPVEVAAVVGGGPTQNSNHAALGNAVQPMEMAQ